MKEVLVSLEVAKLAAEKGFDEKCRYCYGVDVKLYEGLNIELSNSDLPVGDISAPTQSFLQKWLREVKDTDIFVLPFDVNDYSVDVYTGNDEDVGNNINYSTYEEALENGLKIALEGLK